MYNFSPKSAEMAAKPKRSLSRTLLCLLFAVPAIVQPARAQDAQSNTVAPMGGSRVSGQVTSITGASLTLKTRSGASVSIDAAGAVANHLSAVFYVGALIEVDGRRVSPATISAIRILRVKPSPTGWDPDVN